MAFPFFELKKLTFYTVGITLGYVLGPKLLLEHCKAIFPTFIKKKDVVFKIFSIKNFSIFYFYILL